MAGHHAISAVVAMWLLWRSRLIPVLPHGAFWRRRVNKCPFFRHRKILSTFSERLCVSQVFFIALTPAIKKGQIHRVRLFCCMTPLWQECHRVLFAVLRASSKCSHTPVYAALSNRPPPCPRTRSEVLKWLLMRPIGPEPVKT